MAGAIFTRFQSLLKPGHHDKWTEVNLSNLVPVIQRFPTADEWRRRNASADGSQATRAIFMPLLDERAKHREQQLLPQQKDARFDQVRHRQNIQDGQSN